MTLLKTDEATKATAAIYNAAKNIAKTSSANLRLSNLERSVRNMNRNPTNSLRESLIPRNPKKPARTPYKGANGLSLTTGFPQKQQVKAENGRSYTRRWLGGQHGAKHDTTKCVKKNHKQKENQELFPSQKNSAMELYRNHELQPKPPGKLHPYNSLCPQSFAAIWCYMEPPSKLYASTSTTTSYTLQPHGQLSVPYSTASPK